MELIENCKLDRLKPFQKNPRKNDGAVDAVAKSIEQFGAVAPIIVNQDFEICAGHTRFKAATQIGKTTFPVIVVDLKGDNFTGYNIADNQTASIAEWNTLELAALVKELDDYDFDVDALGFDGNELQEILDSLEDDMGKGDPDAVPEPPKKAKSRLGDLYILGDHRVLCGDATNADDVARLMDGAKIDGVIADPPYGIDAVKNSGVLKARYADIKNDDSIAVAVGSFRLFNNGSPMVWFGANYYATVLPNASCWIVWDKNNGGSDQMDCELAWTNFPGVTRMFTLASEKRDRVHPTQKPAALIRWIIERFELGGARICDPFLGSGTTLIACEQLNRKCYGMEIEPIYIDVIVKRWEIFTGRKAVLA